jgi:hypothetical protein
LLTRIATETFHGAPGEKLTAFLELQKEDTRARDQFDMTRKQLA